MAAKPNAPAPGGAQPETEPVDMMKRLKPFIIGGLIAVVGLVIWVIVKQAGAAADVKPWEQLAELDERWRPQDDGRWEDPFGVTGATREEYINKLQKFLSMQEKEGTEGPMVPQVRWKLARTMADHLLSMRLVTDFEKRRKWYEDGIKQLEAIRDDHPSYPLNWEKLKPEGYASFTRKFLMWFKDNRDWDEKYLPKEKDPDGEHTIVVRTTRGDIRFKLYETDAPKFAQALRERAIRGGYDGTTLFEKIDVGDLEQPRQHGFRGGSPESRNFEAYNKDLLVEASTKRSGGGLLPEPSRNRIPFTRGIVSAWHPAATEYDDPQQLMFIVMRSPQNDHDFTPIGKVMDEASLTTLDRIFEQATWESDVSVREDVGDVRGIMSWYQAPIVIKKVLVYDASGALMTTEDVAPTKAPLEENEKSLGALKADAYLSDVPERPKPADSDGNAKDGEGEGDKDAPGSGDGDDAGSGD